MTLETLANDIAAAAEEEAKALIAEAKAEAKKLLADAGQSQRPARRSTTASRKRSHADCTRNGGQRTAVQPKGRPDRSPESARCNLGCRTPTHRRPRHEGSSGAVEIHAGGFQEIGQGKFVIRPVEIDRAAISKEAGDRKVGESVDGLGGFILEAEDGSVSFDMRFDNMLDRPGQVSSLP